MKRSPANRYQRQRGFSLIELMIALVIGLVVIAAVGAMYLNSMESSRFDAGMQRVQENGRFALDMISRSARMAGYDDPLDDDVTTLPSNWFKGTDSSANALISAEGLKASSDTIGFMFQGGSLKADGETGIVDCRGRTVPSNEIVSVLYAVRNDNVLICATSTESNSGSIEIAEGVEAMQVTYGVDTDTPVDGLANRYVDATGVGGNWDNVVSMRVAMLVNSVDNALPVAQTVCLGCVNFQGSNDRLIRAEFETTVALRNFAVE